MTSFETIDYFADEVVTADPYPYLESLVNDRPVWREPHHGVVMVTGYEEALTVYHDPDTFSSCNAVTGPEPNFPVELEGDDIGEIIDHYRHQLVSPDQLPSLDPPKHTELRGLLLGLITPKRLKESEEFMVRLADRLLDDILLDGRCEFMADYCQPYTMLVTAHLLGVPESDQAMLLEQMSLNVTVLPGTTVQEQSVPYQSQDRFYEYFSKAVEDRRKEPRGDVLTGLALAKFPDGTVPDPIEVARVGSILFSAGQGGNTAGMLGAALQRNGDDPKLQQLLRERHDLIPNFVEETLRMEGAVKGDFRLARRSTTLAGVDISAGTTIMILNSAASRDPRRFECPGEFRVERGNARHHLAFGHGIHTCPGAPLARLEGRITVERLLDRTTNIEISEEEHGSSDARRYEYLPTYMFRILSRLHLRFK